jgi:xylan 1,4-beta-xylosidase
MAIRLTLPASPQPLKRGWSLGANTCHAPIVMRSDLQTQLSRAQRELGFRYWRAHGTLSDDVSVFIRHPDGQTHYTFSGLKRILDAVLASGLKPFLELSFLPVALSRDPTQTITHYRGTTAPPVDFNRWEELIGETARFLLATYGEHELRTWYFEVWNEPNIPFWTGTQAEYFQLYRHAARALKAAHPDLRVGGPATARGEWIGDFLDDCARHDAPVDFISTHLYPSDVAFVDAAEGQVALLGMDFLHQAFARVHREVEARRPGLPIIWGEWNSSAGPLAENHDTCENAAVVASALAGMERWANGSLFWNLSDIYEECQYHFAPFHGGYGLLTVDDIPKSAYRAFQFFQQLETHHLPIEGLPATAERGALGSVSSDRTRIAVVLWNTTALGEWTLSMEPPHGYRGANLQQILPGQGSAYEVWIALGRPMNLTAAQTAALETASIPALASGWAGTALTLPPGTAALATWCLAE